MKIQKKKKEDYALLVKELEKMMLKGHKMLSKTLPKHTYSNIWKISPPKKLKFFR